MAFGFQEPLRFDGGHASRARGCDGLTINAILDVARVEHTGDIGARASVRNDVAVGIEIDLADERLGVGNVSDGHKEAGDILLPDAAGLPLDATILGSHHIEQLGVWVERSGVPVGRAAHPRACLGPGDRGGLAGDVYRRAVGMKPASPGHLLYERFSK